MKTASISVAKNRLSAFVDLVRAGETVTITDRGTPVARLSDAARREGFVVLTDEDAPAA